jgi:DNA-binding transcriptional ArsR family regulator
VLHHPDKFGLRGSWAAGVRSRLTPPHRTILEAAQDLFFSSPLTWVTNLTEPKDAATALWALSQIAPAEILPTLAFHAGESSEMIKTLKEVSARGSWNDADLEHLRLQYQPKEGSPQSNRLITTLDWWSRPQEFGERYLAALQAYVTVFFAEEERRIKPYLQQALADAQALAKQLDFPKLMVELSQGVKIAALEQADEVLFVPSYWITPLVMYDCVMEKLWVVLFGARPAEVALVPGEVVPDAMLRALKALSDPTRLLILRYLSDQPQTPSQLARKLRLRAPTVTHHLSALRLAGLVYVSLDGEGEKRYTVRETAVNDTFEALRRFLLV